MKKTYKIRGKEISVEKIDSIKAIKPFLNTRTSFEKVIKEVDPYARETFETLKKNHNTEVDNLEAFANAGWVFVAPKAGVLSSSRQFDKLRDDSLESIHNVYTNETGGIFIDTNSLIIKFRPEVGKKGLKKILSDHALGIIRELKFAPNLFEVELFEGEDIIDKANEMSGIDEVIYIEPQMISYIAQRLKPSDPYYGKQWHLNNNGTNGGKLGADIKIEPAWKISQGRGVKLAIIDNGFDVQHTDINPSIYQLSAGYFLQNGYFRNSLIGFPDSNHGTFCAGMALPRINNLGIVGSANEAEFIPIACLPDQVGTQSTLARSVAYAANPNLEVSHLTPDKGADVIACSLGPNGANWTMESVLEDAINYATTYGRNGKGTPVFWAVSNGNYTINGKDGTDEVSAYEKTIAVGRSNKNDLEDGSAYGAELDFLAPGADVFSCKSGNKYGMGTGTSYAAPLAAGVGALLIGKDPNLSWLQVRDIIRKYCDKVGGVTYDASGHNPKYGYGRINAYEALK
ncbi:S8 family serine peptidase [Flavivirga algicola]|uniref:S8 family serine peptidase n=1 Tax=Flavivirga algicola TaxID=2729136 RepID=A0ABX1RZ20_9FLAO|nr:S8 family serine peptidase [Flavivirga algicola]NMH88235.1 S8 family serine peptidase [Flavivirga algicola]